MGIERVWKMEEDGERGDLVEREGGGDFFFGEKGGSAFCPLVPYMGEYRRDYSGRAYSLVSLTQLLNKTYVRNC